MLPNVKAKQSSDEMQERFLQHSKTVNGFLAGMTTTMFLAVMAFRQISLNMLVPIGDGFYSFADHDNYHNYFVYANLMHASLFLMVIGAASIIYRQDGKYLPYISKKNRAKLDERETGIRRKVFERSYSILFVSLTYTLLFSVYKNFADKPMHFALRDLQFPIIALLLVFVALPSILAILEKDS